ncbi:Cobalamin synthesis CobW domain protein [Nostocoides japonicum T1-X7]|uniref:Cobalamin synthesis CobW domain protein n=1 Tax=Nostocoides japonicum T1-X7 TaxID=1194083 RepID=A0A077M0K0_9MICO|nr:GTP-binding protein [Tetrasphaera japonica]CCH77714.1 Cobalamin synthesis CobW domain protein [Tetrasphaera japonica T1-X7]
MEPSHPRSGLPVVLVTGVDDAAMAAATIGLQWDLPHAVVVSHRIDVEAQRLHRTVSDVSGLLEEEAVDLEHACVSCAIREDIVPTLRRLAGLERWSAVVARLPLSAEASQVCRVLEGEPRPDLRIAAVVAALDGATLAETLTGGLLLAEVGRHCAREDRRGLAEAACGLVEYADVVTVHEDADAAAVDLVRALARPDCIVLPEGAGLDARRVVAGLHAHHATEAWVAETRTAPLPPLPSPTVWRLDLRSDRPFHPERLHAGLSTLGGGPHRSRGCFWLPSRPGQVCAWDGAGGQVSIGTVGRWAQRTPRTRLVVTGLCATVPAAERERIVTAFLLALATEAELRDPPAAWHTRGDGFEPWLGMTAA